MAPTLPDRYLTHILLQQLQHPELRALSCSLLTRLIQCVVTTCMAAGAEAAAAEGAGAGPKGRASAVATAGSAAKGSGVYETCLDVLLGELMGPMVSGLLASLGAAPLQDAGGSCPGRQAVLALLSQLTVQVRSVDNLKVLGPSQYFDRGFPHKAVRCVHYCSASIPPWQAPARLRGFLRHLGPLPSIPELGQAVAMQKARLCQG